MAKGLSLIGCWLLVAVFLVISVAGKDCKLPVLHLPLSNVTLPNKKSVRGIPLSIGNPPQQLVFQPRWQNNNTFLWGPKCTGIDGKQSNTEGCTVFRGGLYDSTKSNTAKGIKYSALEVPGEPWSSDTYKLSADQLSISPNDKFDNFPLAVAVNSDSWDLQGYSPKNAIGMGSNSTFLESLVRSKTIASKSYGYYWGLDGIQSRDQSEGSFVLGGYDRAKTVGDGIKGLISSRDRCASGLVITIRDIQLNFPNGTDYSIFPSVSEGNALAACILPDYPVLMNMPFNPFFDTFNNVTRTFEGGRSRGDDWWDVILAREDKQYDGDLTLSLDGGLDITVPNRQLIVPERTISDSGDFLVNTTIPVIRINSLQDSTSNSLPILGRYLFMGAYLFSNEDAGQFTLWQANPTSAQDLVAMDKSNNIISGEDACVETTAASLPSTLPPKTEPEKAVPGLGIGAIVGIAVGGAALLGGSGLMAWFLLRKRSKRSKTRPVRSDNCEGSDGSEKSLHKYKEDMLYPSQGIPHYIPQELPTKVFVAELE